MRADALFCFLLLALALVTLNATAKKKRRNLRKMQKKNIWREKMRNNAAVKKLANTIDETQQIQQELVSAVGALKENVEDMKEDFVSMTMEMTLLKTIHNINDNCVVV